MGMIACRRVEVSESTHQQAHRICPLLSEHVPCIPMASVQINQETKGTDLGKIPKIFPCHCQIRCTQTEHNKPPTNVTKKDVAHNSTFHRI